MILSAQALTTGYNLPQIDCGICLSGDSSELTNTQSLGRCLRYIPGKEAMFFNLYVDGTQEKVWVTKKSDKLKNVQWISSINEI